ncbi:hypothetical protein AGABI1DRAFT_75673 [Agaricus bisporus var. burnettii JB137-S8]|nr:uncharacterized protein AGABI1DRAFT_75673 [Agaricus bisporus var. burnettii JB137-S8]EKM78202.1 hypothetical protein AGABI1DRAFT_75673 [Agaricus bisporus var. burnettii JB137-S8]
MAKQPPGFPGQNARYVTDFTKALASEVRILLAEVGKLRDERRQLQYEISELMAVKSKHGAGGEYSPDWRPKIEAPPPPSEVQAPPPPPAIEDEPIQARPGWRVVHKRPERRAIKGKQPVAPAPAPPPPMPMPEVARPEIPAWAQWRPNPLLAPTPMSAPNTPPPPPGLFGPPTPPPK